MMPKRDVAAHRCLVLNSDYAPLSTWPLSTIPTRKAVEKVLGGRVDLVADWGFAFRAATIEVPAPKTVVLRQFAKIYADPKFCRRNVLLRDRYRCQYCGERFGAEELT